MYNNELNPVYSEKLNPWIQLLSLLFISLAGAFFIGSVLALLAGNMMTGLGLQALAKVMGDPSAYPEYRTMILVVQGAFSFGAFVASPMIFYLALVGRPFRIFFQPMTQPLMVVVLSMVIVFSFMIVNTVFVEWNMNIDLPDIGGFESWARAKEDAAKDIVQYITKFQSTPYFLIAVLVMALLPAVGEELLFRGMLQNVLLRIYKNGHVAIWVSAIIFGAIHLQFYGVIPRILLGALFGYLYLWTRNLWIPMIGHFMNNFFSLLALYIYQKGLIETNPDTVESLPGVYLIFFGILFIFSIYYLKMNVLKTGIHEKLGDDL